MRSRYLQHKIIIQAVTETQDSFGSIVETWGTFAVVYASINPVRGNEKFIAHQTDSKATLKLNVRYVSGLTTKHRILYDSRIFNIESIVNIREKGKELILMCLEDV